MAMMFYSLGHVLHLNQDLTSPDHVRDNAHPWGHYFESYGKAHYKDTNKNQKWFAQTNSQGWAYWQAQGFTNLLSFWDRGFYTNSVALVAEAGGQVKLGLAEFCNGNFLGERSLYRECYNNPSNIHYFPYPRESSTDFPGNKKTTIITPNGRNLPTTITRNVVTKTRDGVAGFNHSILSYLGTKFPNARTSHSITIKDDDVLQDYHDILIPKAVEYSAGILDYFFRGTLDVSVCDTTITIRNTSDQDFGGGSFFLYKDDSSGNRTYVDQFTNGTLPSLTATNVTENDLSKADPTNKYILVYQGTIGVDSSRNALDPVDTNICIAAKTFTPATAPCGNNCDGIPINIQGFNWEVYPGFSNGTFSFGGTACSFSEVGSLVEVAYLTNSTDCDAIITISAHFVWGNGSNPAFKLTTFFDPSYWDNSWMTESPGGTEDQQFSFYISAHSVTPVYLMFVSNGGFSGTLSFNY